MNDRSNLILCGLLLTTFLLGGCTGLDVLEPKPDETRFFFLESPTGPDEGEIIDQNPVIAIGPVSLAHHLDQPRIVTYSDESEILYSEHERWAEPLDDNLGSFLVNALNQSPDGPRTGLQRIVGPSAEYQVGFHVIRFGSLTTGEAILEVSWWINGGDGKRFAVSERTFREQANAEDISACVQALEKVLLDWASLVSEQLARLY